MQNYFKAQLIWAFYYIFKLKKSWRALYLFIMNAQRYTKDTFGGERYSVGDYLITHITKELYDKILGICGSEYEIRPGNFIIHMNRAPKELLAECAQLVLDNHKIDKPQLLMDLNEAKRKWQDKERELMHLEEIENYMK